jgi:hypothetical protein
LASTIDRCEPGGGHTARLRRPAGARLYAIAESGLEERAIRPRTNSYATYSISCAIVWAVILALAQRAANPEAKKTLQLACGGWWSGWASANIARLAYPPPRVLEPTAERRLQTGSLALVALGLASITRLLLRRRDAGT